ncbi:MAG: hypothetical protein K0Q95_197 [Bacteroidota bacterium]|jgi:hypothetical protein|nr:hypothetical protein [Bacteroidota bacterium]
MKKVTAWLIVCFCIINVSARSQEWKWFTTETDPGATTNIPGQITSDDAGNNFSIGYFFGTLTVSPTISITSAGAADIYIIKRDTDGNPLWAKRFGGTGDDHGHSITLDHSGNIIICGKFNQSITLGATTLSSFGGFDVLVAKLDPTGIPIWAKSFGGSDPSVYESGQDVATDTLNNIYMTGYFYSLQNFGPGMTISPSGYHADMFVLKMNSAGAYQWAKKGGSFTGGNDYDMGVTIKVAPDQNSVVMGGTFQGNFFIYGTDTVFNEWGAARDSYIISLSTVSGAKNFVLPITGAGYTEIEELAIDLSGNIYATGYCESNIFYEPNTTTVNTGRYDIFVFKYNSNGAFAWSTGIGNSSWGHYATGIEVSHQNKLFLSGYYKNYAQSGTFSVNGLGIYLAVLDTNKTTLSMAKATTNLGTFLSCSSMAIDAADNVYFQGIAPAGVSTFGATDYPVSTDDLYTAKYSFTPCTSAPAQPGPISGPATLCSGAFGQVYSISPVPGTTSFTWTFPAGFSGTSTTNNITVSSGTNSGTITVKANNACGSSAVQTYSVTVNTPPPAPTSITGPSTVCSGSSNTYTANTVSGATGYSWNFPSGWIGSITSNPVTQTAGISGTIYVRATNSCGNSPSFSKPVTVTNVPGQPAAISGNINICQGSTNTYSVAAVSGATSYSWTLPSGFTGTSSTSSISTVAGANSGIISVTANNGCGAGTARTFTVNVTALPSLPLPISGNNAICENATNTFSIPGATGASSYTWTLPSGWAGSSTTNSIVATANATGGTISVKGNNSCGSSALQTLPVFINNVVATISTSPSCYSYCSGTATASTSGSGPFTYTWSNSAQTSQTADSLCSGTFTLIVTGAGGCSDTTGSSITSLSPFNLSATHTNASCHGICDGTISTTPVGGTPPYSFTGTATGICAGTYTMNVTDSTGCVASSSVTVTEPLQIITTTNSIGISCNGMCDGVATVNPSGGTAPYYYQWCNGSSAPAVTGMCAGNCVVTIFDYTGCQVIDTIIFTEPAILNANVTAPNTLCEGSCATLNSVVSGGTNTYSYAWSPASELNNSTVANPAACPDSTILFTLTVTDANNCTDTDTLTIIVNDSPNTSYVQNPNLVCSTVPSIILSPGAPSGGYYSGTAVSGNTFQPANAGVGIHTINYIFTNTSGCSDTASSNITVSTCTGIEETAIERVLFYPNPAHEFIFVQSTRDIKELSVYNSIGELILFGKPNTNSEKISLENLSEGFYLIQVLTDSGSYTKKITKE